VICWVVAYGLVASLIVGQPRVDGAEAEIAREMLAFYGDLEGGRWSAMLDHFLPAKVTARWAPPEGSVAWARLSAPAAAGAGAGAGAGSSGRCAPRLSMAVVGDWARVLARRCGAGVDEAWLLRVSGRWKIVRLVLDGNRGSGIGDRESGIGNRESGRRIRSSSGVAAIPASRFPLPASSASSAPPDSNPRRAPLRSSPTPTRADTRWRARPSA
jgi:hypothetical protein